MTPLTLLRAGANGTDTFDGLVGVDPGLVEIDGVPCSGSVLSTMFLAHLNGGFDAVVDDAQHLLGARKQLGLRVDMVLHLVVRAQPVLGPA